MKANQLLLILAGLVVLVIVGAVLGPGPLLRGLGPVLDQPVSLLALLLLVVFGVLWLLGMIRKPRSRDANFRDGSLAEQILRERYARGEMDHAQFAQMLSDLRCNLSPNL
jgi:uncharacterized membrane protein